MLLLFGIISLKCLWSFREDCERLLKANHGMNFKDLGEIIDFLIERRRAKNCTEGWHQKWPCDMEKLQITKEKLDILVKSFNS